MSAGEKAIAKEMKRQEMERKKRIELANKMLIPVSKKTALTLGMISFDPNGVFYLNENRWLKMYRMEGEIQNVIDVVKKITGRIRITLHMGVKSGRATCHLSLMENGELYEEVRQKLLEDETEIAKVVEIHPLSVDEAMNGIAVNFYKEIRFSYASYVRGNKDWKKEVFFEVKEEDAGFLAEGMYGESFVALSFPMKDANGLLDQLENLMCPMYISMDLNSLTEEEHTDYKRAIEKKYNKRLPVNTDETFINLSLSIVLLCDSLDARKILEETIISIFFSHGVVIVPSYHMQRKVCESSLSFGLLDYKIMRNVSLDVAKGIAGGEKDADAEVEV